MRFVLIVLAIAFAITLQPVQAATVPSAHTCAYQQVATDLTQTAARGLVGVIQPGDHAQLDALLAASASADLAALVTLGRWKIYPFTRDPQYPLEHAVQWILKAVADDTAGNRIAAAQDLFISLLATNQAENVLQAQGAGACPAP